MANRRKLSDKEYARLVKQANRLLDHPRLLRPTVGKYHRCSPRRIWTREDGTGISLTEWQFRLVQKVERSKTPIPMRRLAAFVYPFEEPSNDNMHYLRVNIARLRRKGVPIVADPVHGGYYIAKGETNNG